MKISTAAIKRAHYTSAIVLSLFLILHIVNHLFAIAGENIHWQVMLFFRKFYRFPLIEIILLLCVVLQILSGLTLAIAKRKSKDIFKRLQIWSGLYLSFFFAFHVSAVMLGRYVWHVETDFKFAASVVKTYPSKIFFIPYYALSIVALFTHVAMIHYSKMKKIATIKNTTRSVKRQTFFIVFTGMLIATFVLLTLTGFRFSD